MRMFNCWIVALGALLVSSCAAQAPHAQRAAGQRQCFHAGQVNSFWGATDNSVLVRTGVNNVYRLQLSGMCHNIDWANRIGIRSTSGSSWVCQGHDAELLIPSPIGPDRCLVTDIRRLSPDEAKAAREVRR